MGKEKNLIESDKKNICLFGCSFSTGNMGVSALAASLIENICAIYPDANFFLLIGNKKQGEQVIRIKDKKIRIHILNYRLSPKARLKEHLVWIFLNALIYKFFPVKLFRKLILENSIWLKTLSAADFIGDIRGGDSFSDIYGLYRFVIGILPVKTAQLLNKKIVLLPQTYGPYKSYISRIIAKNIIRNADKVVSRDKNSMLLIKNLLRKVRIKFFDVLSRYCFYASFRNSEKY